MRRALGDIALSVLVLLVHTVLVKFLVVGDISPDLPLIWVVYIAIRRGQIAGTITGFLFGLVLDALGASEGMLGLAAFSKTLAGFIAGYFYNENKTMQTLGGYQFIVILAIASAVHNLCYFLIFLQGTTLGMGTVLLRYGLPTTLYTTAAGLIPMFGFSRTSQVQE